METPLQTKQLAARLNIPSRKVVEWAVAGLLPCLSEEVGRGSSRLYLPESVERGRLLCRLNAAGIGTRDIRKLVPIIENALANDIVLSVPHPIQVGKHLFTLCQLPLKGPVLVEGVPPGQTVIPLLALDELSPEGRQYAAENK
jgi:DNA-binding transcriptional MerR regulator